MIQLAANDSSALRSLMRKINPPVDYLKLPLSRDLETALPMARALRPVLLHGWGGTPFRAGMADIPRADDLEHLIRTSGTPFLSVHLDVQPDDLERLTPGAALERVAQTVERLRELSGLPVLLENIAHYEWSERPGFVSDPQWITAALEMSDAHLLLDLAHARVSAYHRREHELEYLDALPLERTWEIHLSAPRLENDGLRDRHLPLQGRDYELLERVLERATEARFMTLEYGGIPDVGYTRDGAQIRIPRNDSALLLEQIAHLDTIKKRLNGALKHATKLPQGWHIDERRRTLPEEELSLASIRALGY
jgi:uncharacterized protein (UPF0276 family)